MLIFAQHKRYKIYCSYDEVSVSCVGLYLITKEIERASDVMAHPVTYF